MADAIDFAAVLIGCDGDEIPYPKKDGKGEEPLTLARACGIALTALYNDEPNIGGDEKIIRGLLARRIYVAANEAEKPLKLKARDVVLVKKLVGKMFGPNVVLPAWELLEPDGNGTGDVQDGIKE